MSPFAFPNLPAAELAAPLAARAPLGPAARAFFTAGGSDAVESALKIAKQAQRKRGFAGRTKVLARRYAYHGSTMGALSVTGWAGIRQPFEPLVPGARHVPLPHRYRCRACALDQHPNVGDIRGMGLLVAIELVHDRWTKQPLQEEHLMAWLSENLKQRGVICRADDRLDPVIQLAPPLTIPHEDVDRVVEVIAEVLHVLGQHIGSIASMPIVAPQSKVLSG